MGSLSNSFSLFEKAFKKLFTIAMKGFLEDLKERLDTSKAFEAIAFHLQAWLINASRQNDLAFIAIKCKKLSKLFCIAHALR